VLGDAFVGDLVVAYARRWPEVRVELALTRRRVALVEEGFDVAFRVGSIDDADASLTATSLGVARVRYCASRAYVRRAGAPQSPRDLARHACIVVSEIGAMAWPFRGKRKGVDLVPVSGRVTTTSFATARAAVLAGLGVGIFPEFACAADVRRKRLVTVLDAFVVPVGSVWLLHAARRFLPARVAAFVDLARERFAKPPW
jgi:DNA-binding transcriptional LysR family regulator